MKRSVSVTLSAILALIGSVCCVGSGAIGAVAILVERGKLSETPASTATALFGMLVLVIPGVWGVATGIGLLLLKGWARVSMLIFASLLALSIFGAPMMLLIPFPPTPGADATLMTGIRIGMATFYVVLGAVGIWWLVLFSRPSVKLQFSGGHPVADEGGRPLSISIIAWLLLLGAAFMPFALFARMPAIFLGSLLSGWAAALVYATYLIVCLYLGIGLLRLKPLVRTLTIYYSIFAIVNMAFFYLRPGYDARMAAVMNANNFFHSPQPVAVPALPIFVITSAMMGVQIYFLATRKRAFDGTTAGPTPSLS
jgi:hypothetical protein